MAQTQKKQQDMGTGDVKKLLLQLMIPAVVAQVVNLLYNIVDRIYIGHISGIGAAALTGVGLFTPILMLLNAFAMLIGAGGAPRTAIAMGQGDKEQAEKIISNSFTMLMIFAVLLTVVFYASAPTLLRLFGASDTTLPYALAYSRIYILGSVCVLIVMGMNPFITTQGFAKISMLTTVIGAVINIILDPILIFGFGLGVQGAAIATDISQLVSCVLSLRFLMRVEDDYRVTAKDVRVHKKMAVRIIKVGLPTGIQNMVISLSNVLVQVSVNGYGAAAMAGFAAYMKVDGFNILPVLSFSMAATTFVGQNFGAGKIDRVKKGTFVTLGMCIVYTILTGILLLAFQDPIMHLFTGDETVIAYGKICMLYFCPFYWMLGILQGLAGTVRGPGKSVPPMVVLLISLCLFRIVWIQFALPLFAGIEGVLLVYPVSWAVGAVLMVLYAWKGKWMQLPEAIS